MSVTETQGDAVKVGVIVGTCDMKLEVVALPVSDLDRAKEFYGRLGWRLEADFSNGGERVIQLTPPGSPASVHMGTGVTRDDLARRGVEVGEIFHYGAGPFGGQVSGAAPDQQSYGS